VNEIVTLRRNEQEEAKLAWERAISGEVTYMDVEAEVVDGEKFKYKTPISKLTLYTALDKPRPIGEHVILRIPAMDVASWDYMFSMFPPPEKHPANTVVYVLLMENGTVKIGRSKNFEQRKATISTSSGMVIKKHWHTKKFTRAEASKIETGSHKHFKANRIKGEFFSVDFDKACAYVEKLADQLT
jgi:hypothetical protein